MLIAFRFYNQRTEMIKKLKNAGGDWPMTSEKLVNNYLKIFAQFVNSIDFTDL
jgi:hypothetical protein